MRVIVLGAGIAGLAAAQELKARGHEVLVVEARDRIGGRIVKDRSSSLFPLEMGATIIHGLKNNPIATIAARAGFGLRPMSSCRLYDYDGTPVPTSIDRDVEVLFNNSLELASRERDHHPASANDTSRIADKSLLTSTQHALNKLNKNSLTALEARLIAWHHSNLEFACGGLMNELSHKNWDQDDENELEGEHCIIKEGFSGIIDVLSKGLDILLNAPVSTVCYNETDVTVELQDGRGLKAQSVICTLSLGVLKSNMVKFRPALPVEKTRAIKKLGFGCVNKVALRFSKRFWDSEDFIGYVSKTKGAFFLFIDCTVDEKYPGLLAVLPPSVEAGERQREDDLIDQATSILEKIYKDQYEPPLFTQVSRWGKDVYSQGSYSYIPVGASGQDYDLIAKPVTYRQKDELSLDPSVYRVLFAGEGAIKEYPTTAHGAFISGIREARRLDGEKILIDLDKQFSFSIERVVTENVSGYRVLSVAEVLHRVHDDDTLPVRNHKGRRSRVQQVGMTSTGRSHSKHASLSPQRSSKELLTESDKAAAQRFGRRLRYLARDKTSRKARRSGDAAWVECLREARKPQKKVIDPLVLQRALKTAISLIPDPAGRRQLEKILTTAASTANPQRYMETRISTVLRNYWEHGSVLLRSLRTW